MGIKNLLASFFARKLTQQVKELYSSNLILSFGISAIMLYEPIFIFLLFKDKYNLSTTLRFVLLFYLAVYCLYFFILPLGAKFARRFGYEHSIAFSSFFTIAFYLSLFGSSIYLWLLPLAVLMYVGSKTLYWPAYHSDFARFSEPKEQGRQISNLRVLNSLVAIVGPVLGGLVLKFYGFGVLFIMVSIIILLSNVPTLLTPEQFDPNRFSYFDAYRRIFKKKHRKKLLAHIGFGEELIAATVWPIFIYVIVGDFLELGALVSISVLVSTIIFLFIGRATDKTSKKSILRRGSVFYFFSWVLRLIVRSILGVFLIDSYARVSKQAVSIPFHALTYKKAQDTQVMKAIIFFEMSLVVGKITAIVLALIALSIFAPGWNAIFILAALMTLLYALF